MEIQSKTANANASASASARTSAESNFEENEAVRAVKRILSELMEILVQVSEQVYLNVPKPFFQSSVGAHVRHCLDHFYALLQAFEDGNVDYEKRERGTKLETNKHLAVRAVQELRERFGDLKINKGDGRMPVCLSVALEAPMNKNFSVTWVNTTLERELHFVTSHTVHHLALVKVMCAMQGETLGSDVGLAAGTKKWFLESEQCAR